MGGGSRCTTRSKPRQGGLEPISAGNRLGDIPEGVCDPAWGSVRMGGGVLGWAVTLPEDAFPGMSGCTLLPRMSFRERIFLVKHRDVSFHPHSTEGWLLPFPGHLLWKESWPFASLLSVN